MKRIIEMHLGKRLSIKKSYMLIQKRIMMQKRNGRGKGSWLAKAGDPGNGSKPTVTGIEPFVPAGSCAVFIDDELRKYNEKLMEDIRNAMGS